MPQGKKGRAVRSDSIRNREAILLAAAKCLTDNPSASLADIAHAAGVGRVTLYGHFASREELVGALLHQTMVRVEAELSSVDLGASSWAAMDALAAASWGLVHSLNVLRSVAERELPTKEMHSSHEDPRTRLFHLLARGRGDGSFRTDQTIEWQAACYFSMLHGAASEVGANRLTEAEVTRVFPQTLRLLLARVNESS